MENSRILTSRIKNVKIYLVSVLLTCLIVSCASLIIDFFSNMEAFKEDVFYDLRDAIQIRHHIVTLLNSSIFTSIIVFYILKRRIMKFEVLDSIPQPIIVYNMQGVIIHSNKSTMARFGYDDRMIGDNVVKYIAPGDRQKAMTNLKKYNYEKDKDILKTDSYCVMHSDGTEVNSFIFRGFYDSKHFISTIIDHDKVNNAEITYSNKLSFFWSILNNIPTPISYRDGKGMYRFVNASYSRLTGLYDYDIIGKDFKSILPGKSKSIDSKNLDYVIRNREPVNYEEEALINNKVKTLEVDMYPSGEDDENNGVFTYVKDITRDVEHKNQLKKEIILNQATTKISELMTIADKETIYKLIDDAFSIILDTLSSDRCYMLMPDEDHELQIKYETSSENQKPYEGFVLDVPDSHKNFYEKFMSSSKAKISSENVKLSKYHSFHHLKLYGAKSFMEVSAYVAKFSSTKGILGVVCSDKYRGYNKGEIDFLSSAGKLVLSALDRIEKNETLNLSEETLNTLIDNTDIGIVISNYDGDIYYKNKSYDKMFNITGFDLDIRFSIESYMSIDQQEKMRNMCKEREYKGYCGGVLILENHKQITHIKLYSSKVDYEDSKAYLTTIVDITEYMK